MGEKYERIKARKGGNKAAVAIAHSILKIVYHILLTKKPFNDLGNDYHLERKKDHEAKRANKRLERLGFSVQITEQTA